MGGGQGTRLFPLTRDRAKPAVPVAGRVRLIDIPLSNCINSGITRMFVLTQFNSASLNMPTWLTVLRVDGTTRPSPSMQFVGSGGACGAPQAPPSKQLKKRVLAFADLR